MNILVNLFHPNLQQSKVNRRWLEVLEEHGGLTINQPYQLYSDWTIDVEREQHIAHPHVARERA